jgi:hypothetical protein
MENISREGIHFHCIVLADNLFLLVLESLIKAANIVTIAISFSYYSFIKKEKRAKIGFLKAK